MKKSRVLGLLLACMLLLTSLYVPSASAAGGSGTVTANDIVIVVDISSSMRWRDDNNRIHGNDPEGYRFDAAQVVVGMCDMEHSRVAIVPFAGNVYGADTEFTPISDMMERQAKLSGIEDRRYTTQGDTDVGNALNYAIKLLIEREDKTNAPMIIVLTDGEQAISKNNQGRYRTNETVYVWNFATNSYEIQSIQRYDVNDAAEQLNKAVEAAKTNNIPIYTVALNAEEMTQFAGDLSRIANETGGTYHGTSLSDDVSTLPVVFGKMFATQIGSSLRETLGAEAVDGKKGYYRVEIPILNLSVLEANVYIPLTNVDADSIALYDNNGNIRTSGGQDVVKLDAANFRLYKIYSSSARTIGTWTLEFKLKDDSKSVDDVSLNLLYHYDVEFKSKLGSANLAPAFVSQSNPPSFGKCDALKVSGSFYTVDDQGNLTPSTDSNLYADYGNGWETINVTCYVTDAAGNRKGKTVTLQSNHLNAFDLSIDLTQIDKDENGRSTLTSGSYVLHVNAEGAGMNRTEEIPFVLTNTAPVATANLQHNVRVNDETLTAQGQIQSQQGSVLLTGPNTFFRDDDNDPLAISVTAGNGADILNVQPRLGDDGLWYLDYNTVVDPITGKEKFGTAEYTLTVDDGDGGRQDFAFTFYVTSNVDSVIDNFTWVTTQDGIDETTQTAGKNSPITFTLTLTNPQDPSVQIDPTQLKGTVHITDDQGRIDIPVPMDQWDPDTRTLKGTYTTDNRYGVLKAECRYTYAGVKVEDPANTGAPTNANRMMDYQFTIPNTPPAVNEETVENYGAKVSQIQPNTYKVTGVTLTCSPLPAFLSFVETPTPEEKRTFDLNQWFKDGENEQLTYAIVNPGDGSLTCDLNGDAVLITPLSAGSTVVVVSATDGDKEVAQIELHIGVVSLVMKWLIILAVAVAVIIVIYMIYLASRPRYFKGMLLTVRSNTAIDPDQIIESIHGQKKIKLDTYVVEPTALEKSNVTRDDLAMLTISPLRGRSPKIKLKFNANRKSLANPSVELGGVEMMPGKALEWACDTDLVVRNSAGGSNLLRITLGSSYDAMGGGGYGVNYGGDYSLGGDYGMADGMAVNNPPSEFEFTDNSSNSSSNW